MPPDPRDGWNEYRRLVIENFLEIKARLSSIEECLQKVKIDLTVTKTKLAMWGAVGGMIGGAGLAALLRVLFP